MAEAEFYSQSEAETEKIAQKILQTCKNSRIFAIYGDLGAGKTTLIQAFCKFLEVKDSVKSPTFSIVNEYHLEKGKVFHFDFYRIKDERELFDIGFEEYISSGEYIFIEWPGLIIEMLPESAVRIMITPTTPTQRLFKISF